MVAATPTDIAASRHRVRMDPLPGAMLALVIGASAVILILLAIVLGLSFVEGDLHRTPVVLGAQNYAELFTDSFTYKVILDTVVFSLVTVAVALAFGVPMAWLVARTDLPGKTMVFTLMTVGILIPGFTTAMGWLFLLHPKVGMVNVWLMGLLSLSQAPFSIANMIGMGFVQGLSLAAVAFIMTAAVFRAIDPALEEAAYMAGANYRRTGLAITLRLAWPGILAAAIYIFTIGFAAFDVPAIIGWGNRRYTFSTYLLVLLNTREGLPQYGAAAALASVVIGLAALLSWWYATVNRRARQFEVVSGKGYRPRLLPLGRWALPAWGLITFYLVLSKLLPLLVLVWASLLPYLQLPSTEALASLTFANYGKINVPLAQSAVINTVILMVLVPTLTLALSIAFSWIILRSRLAWRLVFDFIAFLPHAVPNVIFAVAALLLTLFVIDKVIPIYGTIWILLIVFVIDRLSYGTRMTNGGLIQLNRELDESAYVSGATTFGAMRSVLVPLLAPTLTYAWLWIAIMTFRELTLAAMLTTYDNMTMSVLVWSLWSGGNQGTAAAVGLIMLGLMLPMIAVYWVVARRRGMIDRG
jgi:iron(III) transport system permease protein